MPERNRDGRYLSIGAPATFVDHVRPDGLNAWRPDAIGSVCFLVSSVLAWYEVCHGWSAWRPRDWSWWITLANLILHRWPLRLRCPGQGCLMFHPKATRGRTWPRSARRGRNPRLSP